MKRFFIFVVVLASLQSYVHSQISEPMGDLIFEDTLDFNPTSNWITINNPETSIWKIGKPGKNILNSGHSGDTAIITGLADYYPTNLNDYFTITVPTDYFFGEGILSFYHAFDTDTLSDGGIIEISYDNGTTWINVVDDIEHIRTSFIGLSGVKIQGTDYGFSGKSGGWQYVELYWYWIALTKKSMFKPICIRFRFVSDETETNKEGWLIDDIVFRGYDVTGSIGNSSDDSKVLYPNPTDGFVNFDQINIHADDLTIILYGLSGEIVKTDLIRNNKINISDLNPGIYVYRILKGDGSLYFGKLVKN